VGAELLLTDRRDELIAALRNFART
jgi:hypothetical protein